MRYGNSLQAAKVLTIFSSGAFAYGLIEIAARGFTHISMGILGGLAMLLIHVMNTAERTPLRLFFLLVASSAFITLSELITGEIVNVHMGLEVWDYSMMPLNFNGQICLPFTFLWFALSAVGVLFDDFLRIRLFRENRTFLFAKFKERTTA